MALGAEGIWSVYFGDSTAVPSADETDNNLDFGLDVDPAQVDVSAATNVYINATQGVIKNAPALSNWNNTINEQSNRGTLNSMYDVGQISVQDASDDLQGNGQEWPFIQLYDFTIGNFDVVYEQAGADEVVSLDYNSADLDDFSGLELDRSIDSQGSELHLTITDNQLNIDPTSEDIVIIYVETISEGVSFTNSSGPKTTD
jgi:hypothetical protein